MRIVLVGKANGHRQVRWGVALLLACVLGILCSLFATAIYFAVSGTFSVPTAMIAFFGPLITVGCGIQSALKLPIEQLMPLDRSPA
jgi:hypothetical protein